MLSKSDMEALRPRIRRALQATGIYERLEWSPMHRLYVRFNNPRYEARQAVERSFYAPLLREGSLVFDIGAHKGSKCEVFLDLGARVVAVEPDPQCVSALRRRFVFNSRLHVVPTAVGASEGLLELLVNNLGSEYNTLSPKWRDHRHSAGPQQQRVRVKVTTLDALIARHGVPDFVKIDVEGFEREVLMGLSSPVDLISLEANLPEFRDETRECIRYLSALDARYRFNVADDLSQGLQHQTWLEAAKIDSIIESTDRRYCEIFARRT